MHEKFLLAALEQARLGQGQCAPNPCVGAVAVQNDNIIAQLGIKVQEHRMPNNYC